VAQVNGFEQLLINYANERLQLFFIESSLRKEQDEYAREGIGFVPLAIEDNAHVCALLGSPAQSLQPGLFAVLDDRAQLADRGGGGGLLARQSSSSSFTAKGAAASLSWSDASALASAQLLLDVLDDKMNHPAFCRQASATAALDGGAGGAGSEEAANDSGGYSRLQPAAGDGGGFGGPGEDAAKPPDPSSTFGVVFDEAAMRFVKVDVAPPGTTYDDVKMQFVPLQRPKARTSVGSPHLSPQQSLPALEPPASPVGGSSSSAYRGSVHFRSRKDNGDLAGQLFGVRHYAGEVGTTCSD
jgi:hypothetical protein